MRFNSYIAKSNIHGRGLFSKWVIREGQYINYDYCHCMMNHSLTPNTKRGKRFGIIATKIILPDEEITENYYELPAGQQPPLPIDHYMKSVKEKIRIKSNPEFYRDLYKSIQELETQFT